MRAHGRSTAGRRPAGDGAAADGRKLGLRGWLGLRDALLSAFGRVIAYARAQAAAAERDPTSAVHEFRKSVRRARAVVRLLRPLLEPEEYVALEAELRAALTSTSGLRDAHVLGQTLARVAPRTPNAPRGIAAAVRSARKGLDRRAAESSGLSRPALVLAGGAERLELLPAQLAAALPRRVDAGDVARGLARLFRRASAALDSARGEPTDETIHNWRKRVKELRYALELLERPAVAGAGPLRRAAAHLAEGLGEVTDLILLRRELLQLEGDGVQAVKPLTDDLEDRIQAGFAGMVRVAEPLSAHKPRAIADDILSGLDGLPRPPPPAPPPLVRPRPSARRPTAAGPGSPPATTKA